MKRLLLIVILLFPALVILFHNYSKDRCLASFECQWKIVNCCPEEAGAEWKCVNIKNFEERKCPGFIICPQFLSPKPNLSCVCEKGECVVK